MSHETVLLYPQLQNNLLLDLSSRMGPTGNLWVDNCPYGNRASFTGYSSSTWNVSGGKYAVIMNGTSQAATTGTLPVGGETKLSFALWMKWGSFTNADTCGIELSANMGSANAFFFGPDDPSGKAVVYVSTASNTFNSGQITRPAAGEWHHWAFAMDRSKGAAINVVGAWIDGVQQTVTLDFADTTTGTFTANPLYVAARGASSLWSAAEYDDIRLYRGLIDSASVKLLATRRGIANETRRIRRVKTSGAPPAGNRRRRLLIGS